MNEFEINTRDGKAIVKAGNMQTALSKFQLENPHDSVIAIFDKSYLDKLNP